MEGAHLARTRNPARHAIRRDAFVDVALRLIQTKGYEQMSVQDVLDELDASRGAFYHYFDSKGALLEAALDRMLDTGVGIMEPVVADPTLPAAEKFGAVFAGVARWKTERKELVLAILRVWLSDENAIVRDKLRHGMVTRITPILVEIIRQGCTEGVFTATSPESTARVLVSLLMGAQETAGDLFVARQADAVPLESVEQMFSAYAEAYERILGAPPGSLAMIDEATLHEWFG